MMRGMEPDDVYEPAEERDPHELAMTCAHRRVCMMQFMRNGDPCQTPSEWCGCDEDCWERKDDQLRGW